MPFIINKDDFLSVLYGSNYTPVDQINEMFINYREKTVLTFMMNRLKYLVICEIIGVWRVFHIDIYDANNGGLICSNTYSIVNIHTETYDDQQLIVKFVENFSEYFNPSNKLI